MRIAALLPVLMLHAATASAETTGTTATTGTTVTTHAAQPRTVEKGGGIGRMFAWTTMLAGITGGLAAGGIVIYTKQQLDDCNQHTLLGLGCGDQQRSYDDATKVATIGGIAAGGMLLTSIVLFVATDGKHTEIEYGDPPPPSLPIGGYVATGITLAGAITAQVMMNNARDSLGDPNAHPTQDETESLSSRYRYTRYAAGGLYGLSALFGAMSAWETFKVVRSRNAGQSVHESPQVSLSPTPNGAVFALAGRF